MSKKNKNIILGLIVVFFVSLALLFSENSSKIISYPNKIEKEVGEVFEKEVKFVSKTEDSDEAEEVVLSEEFEVREESVMPVNMYKVVKVVDGDTVDVNIDGKEERLRLIGIDTPETVDPRKDVECFGREASEKTKVILLGKNVILEQDETQGNRDKYNRLLRYVFLEDGTNFNLLMIRDGYAHEYTYDEAYKYQNEFKLAENEARENKKGLWGDSCSLK